MELRDYQQVLIDGTREKLRNGVRRCLMVAPTGAGKTVMAAFMQGGAAQRGLTTWFVVHRIEILLRTAETFRECGIDFGVVADTYVMRPSAKVQLCMVMTLATRMHLLPKPDGIVWDEAHHIVAGAHGTIAQANPQAWHVGVTATPERLDGRGLAPFFDCMVTGPTTAELMRRGFLAKYRYFAPGVPDFVGGKDGLNRRNVAEIMGSNKLIGEAVDAWGKLAEGKRTINFELSRKASQATVKAFKASGIPALHVDGDMDPDARKEAFARFAAGDVMVLSNVAIAGEGVDIPAIEAVMLRDPTNSLTKYLQEVGRGFRLFPGKDEAIILDPAGNAFVHGLPCDERTWSLKGAKDRGRMQALRDAVPIRQCPDCFRVSYSSVKVCPGCGYEHASVYRPPQWAEGELYELERTNKAAEKAFLREAEQKRKKAEERACASLADFMRLGMSRGYKNAAGWARMKVQLRHQYGMRLRGRA